MRMHIAIEKTGERPRIDDATSQPRIDRRAAARGDQPPSADKITLLEGAFLFHNTNLRIKHVVVATALSLGASGLALADDNSMAVFSGDSYHYFSDAQKAGQRDPTPLRAGRANAATE